MVCQASLLEANAVVAALAGEWAGALAGLLLQDFAGLQPQEPVEVCVGHKLATYCPHSYQYLLSFTPSSCGSWQVVPLAPEADELDPVALLDIYRECLKVSH